MSEALEHAITNAEAVAGITGLAAARTVVRELHALRNALAIEAASPGHEDALGDLWALLEREGLDAAVKWRYPEPLMRDYPNRGVTVVLHSCTRGAIERLLEWASAGDDRDVLYDTDSGLRVSYRWRQEP